MGWPGLLGNGGFDVTAIACLRRIVGSVVAGSTIMWQLAIILLIQEISEFFGDKRVCFGNQLCHCLIRVAVCFAFILLDKAIIYLAKSRIVIWQPLCFFSGGNAFKVIGHCSADLADF